MRVGTMLLGKVDSAHGESIQTKFFVIGVPIAPVRGLEIALHGRSVRLAYLRTTLVAVTALAGYYAGKTGNAALALIAVAGVVVWLWAMFAAGHLAVGDRLRRKLRFDLIGTGMSPELLPYDLTEPLRRRLTTRWQRDRPDEAWEDAIGRGETSEILFHLAELYDRPRLADAVYARLRHERGDPTA